MAAAYRAYGDVDLPACLKDLCNRHIRVSPPVPLAALQLKDELQVLCFVHREDAAYALKQILTECGLSIVILVGQSMGGYISQAFMCRFPKMVKVFIAIDSTPYGKYYSKTDIWWLRQIEWMSKLFPEKLLKSVMSMQNAVTDAGRANMSNMIALYSKSELCHLMGIGYAGFLKDNREMTISCPLLLLVGERDKTGKVRAYNREWAKRTGCELYWIPNAAHNSNVDNPDSVNNHIKSCKKKSLYKLYFLMYNYFT